MPDPLNMADASHPLHAMAMQMQQKQQMDAKRAAMAQALMPQQAQGPAPVGNSTPFQMPQQQAQPGGMGAAAGGLSSGLGGLAKMWKDSHPYETSFNTAQTLPGIAGGQQALQNAPVMPNSGITIGRS